MKKASFGIRFAAFLLDVIIISILTRALNLLIALVVWSADPPITELNSWAYAMLLLDFFFALVYWVFIPYLTKGQTLGKKICRIRVQRVDGERPGIGSLLLREVIGRLVNGLTLTIGYLIALGKERRGLHDYIGGTVVVKN
jgi:uncharacterized RDD family membrane protein YckC